MVTHLVNVNVMGIGKPARMEENLYSLSTYIPLSECKHGWFYRIMSRNLTLGVYREDRKGFVGIREKFEHLFLFVEFHWDTGPPFGTVKPLECLERCPISNLNEHIEPDGDKSDTNGELFEWLKDRGGVPPHHPDRRKHLRDLQMLTNKRGQRGRK